MGIIDDIKLKANKATLNAFKQNLKKMTADQILDLMNTVGNDTAKNIFKEIEKSGKNIAQDEDGVTINYWQLNKEDFLLLKEKWLR